VMTTLLCVFFMGMQVRANVLWWRAAERVGTTGAPTDVLYETSTNQESN